MTIIIDHLTTTITRETFFSDYDGESTIFKSQQVSEIDEVEQSVIRILDMLID